MSKEHLPWPKIKRLENVAQNEHHRARFSEMGHPSQHLRTVVYRGKVKLHGTNAGIRCVADGDEWNDDKVNPMRIQKKRLQAQSRKFDINVERDNQGFAKFTADHALTFLRMENIRPGVTVFGEWCGPGIQHGVAINEAPKPFFAVFAVVDGDIVVSDPRTIREHYVDESHEQVHVLDWFTDPIYINFALNNQMERDDIATMVSAIDDVCPFAKEVLGVEGVGEGLVMFPLFLYEGNEDENGVGAVSYAEFATYGFKAKGSRHNTGKKKEIKRPDMTPEKLQNIQDFVESIKFGDMSNVLTALGVGNEDVANMSNKGIGPFIKAVQDDIKAERADNLPEGVTWKDVAKQVGKKALGFYQKLQSTLVEAAPPPVEPPATEHDLPDDDEADEEPDAETTVPPTVEPDPEAMPLPIAATENADGVPSGEQP